MKIKTEILPTSCALMLNSTRNCRQKKKAEHKTKSCNKDITCALLMLLKGSSTAYVARGTMAEQIAGQLIRQALEGKFPAIKEILDRTEGRVQAARSADDHEKLTVIITDIITADEREDLEAARQKWRASAL